MRLSFRQNPEPWGCRFDPSFKPSTERRGTSLSVKAFGLAALTGLAVVGFDASPVRAQMMMPAPAPMMRPAAGFGAPMGMPWQMGRSANPLFAAAAGNLAYGAAAGGAYPGSAYGGSGYSGYGYSMESGGALYGAAAVMNAQGQFKVSRQQSRLLAEQVRTAQTDNKKRAFDEYLYEQRNTPTPEETRQEAIKQQLSHSLTEPNATEIQSATALNSILGALLAMPGVKADSPALTEDVLKRVNVVKGAGNVSSGLLRDEGKLTFPQAVRALAPADQTAAELRTLDSLARDAYAQATAGRVDGDLLKKMQEISTSLNDRLTKVVNETQFGQYSEGKRFLRALDDAIAALRQTDAAEFLPGGKNVARGKDVAALVKYMDERGLRFAPANPGDVDAYKIMHRALADYHKAAAAQLAASGTGR
jgi:hypothetical protein